MLFKTKREFKINLICTTIKVSKSIRFRFKIGLTQSTRSINSETFHTTHVFAFLECINIHYICLHQIDYNNLTKKYFQKFQYFAYEKFESDSNLFVG